MSAELLVGDALTEAKQTIVANHYARKYPSAKQLCYRYGDALVVFGIPANPYLERFILGDVRGKLYELTRLWAPDGHEPNLLTQAISYAAKALRAKEPDVVALCSYADSTIGHEGYVYRAASWVYTGRSMDNRYFVAPDGTPVARRSFHGKVSLRDDEIIALGYKKLWRPGKLRYAKGLTKNARRRVNSLQVPFDNL